MYIILHLFIFLNKRRTANFNNFGCFDTRSNKNFQTTEDCKFVRPTTVLHLVGIKPLVHEEISYFKH